MFFMINLFVKGKLIDSKNHLENIVNAELISIYFGLFNLKFKL